MRIYKNRYTFCLILTLIILSSAGVFFPMKDSSFELISEGHDALNLSDDELVIITPENKTYIEPMSGYYPATYGFENDEDGSFPMEWIDASIGPSSEVVVASEMAEHKKVLHYSSLVHTSRAHTITNLSSSQTSGSIEYYVYKETGEGGFEVNLRNSTDDYALRIGIDYMNDGMFVWRTSSTTAQQFGAGKYSDNTWFHIRIDFDILAKKFDIYLDGVKEVDQEDLFYDINSVQHMRCDQTGTYCGWYLDALSFSWDLDYNVGENQYEGLLLGFENSTRLDWIGYSLDGQSNKTILGNVTFPMPSAGSHAIQVFGSNTLGTMYQSNKVLFTCRDAINIFSPENITYTAPMSGYYPATYGFENEEDGNFPMGWIDESTGTLSEVVVASELAGHKKVLHYYSYATHYSITRLDLSSPQIYGSIEFYVYKDAGLKGFEIILRNSTDDYALRIGID